MSLTAPVTFMKDHDGTQGFYKEKLSYEHQYNSRTDPNYPIRSKVGNKPHASYPIRSKA